MTTTKRRLPQQIKKKNKRPNPNESWAVMQNTIIKNEYLSKRKKEKILGNKVKNEFFQMTFFARMNPKSSRLLKKFLKFLLVYTKSEFKESLT